MYLINMTLLITYLNVCLVVSFIVALIIFLISLSSRGKSNVEFSLPEENITIGAKVRVGLKFDSSVDTIKSCYFMTQSGADAEWVNVALPSIYNTSSPSSMDVFITIPECHQLRVKVIFIDRNSTEMSVYSESMLIR